MTYFSYVSAILVLSSVVCGQSPCSGVFDYISDEADRIYGLVTVRPTRQVSSLLLRVNFTIAARINRNNVGRIELLTGGTNHLQNFNRGVPLQYRIVFPVTSPLPRITAITANDDLICYGRGDIPSPIQYVTMTTLQHKLFLKVVSPGLFQYDKPVEDFDFPDPLPNDGQTHQIFTYDENGNKLGSFNATIVTVAVPNRDEFPVTHPTHHKHPRPPEPHEVIVIAQPLPPPTSRPIVPPPATEPSPTQPPPTQPPPTQPPPTQPPPTQSPPPQPQTAQPQQFSSSSECGIVLGGNEQQPLIFSGQSFNRGEWPWLVAIYKRKYGSLSFICSGSLVSDRHVVTAAHCMQSKTAISSNKDIVVKVGVYNLEDWGDDIAVTRNIVSASIHEAYNASSLANDISILTFERSVEFNTNIRPVCLWNGNPDLSRIVGASGVVAGWGQSEFGQAGRGEPRAVRVPVVSTSACRASRPDFHKLTSTTTLCAGDRNGAGPCLGDSGGGLFLLEGGRWRLRGVVSLSLRPDNGDSTCNLNEYIVFTDSAQYIDWIQSVMHKT